MSGPATPLVQYDVKSVSRETYQRLTVFHDVLSVWQKRINLISPSTINQIWDRHIEDSLQCCSFVGAVDHVIDIGSGAGFPGLVQAIVMAEHKRGRVDLVESNGKKCAFMNAVIRETGLKACDIEVNVHNGRIEDVLPELPQPAAITARALAPLNDLLGLTEVFMSNGTVGVFPKGRGNAEEIVEARAGWTFDCETIQSKLEDGSVLLKIAELSRL